MNLYRANKKDYFKIIKLNKCGEIGKRMAEMGLCCGSYGKVVRKGLLGGPIQIGILNYNLSLRKAEAEGVEIELVGEEEAKNEPRINCCVSDNCDQRGVCFIPNDETIFEEKNK